MSHTMHSIHLGDVFSLRRESGQADLPLLSVTIRNGIVPRDSREHKVKSTLAHGAHLVARTGDIVYNMMRMWQGASGIATCDGNVSPAYVVCIPSNKIDARFAHHLFHSPGMIYRFWAYSHGITDDRRRLYFDDFSKVPAVIPPLHEQIVIARILDTYDRAIAKTATLVSRKRQLQRGLLQQLLSGQRRLASCKTQWRTFQIGELLKEVRRTVQVHPEQSYRLVSIRRNSGGLFDRPPQAGSSIGYTKLMSVSSGDFVIARRQVVHGAMAMAGKRHEGTLVSNAYATLVPVSEERLHMPFFDFLSQTPAMYHRAFRCSYGVTVEKLVFNLEWFFRETVSVPGSTDEQRGISDVLTTQSREIRLLERRVKSLQKEKSGLMQQLLTGDVRVPNSLLKKGGKA